MSIVEQEIRMIPEASFCLMWGREAGRKDPLFLLSYGAIEGSRNQRLTREERLWYLEIDARRRLILHTHTEQIEMATFGSERRGLTNRWRPGPPTACFLLNGNGFDDARVTGLQARIRDRLVGEFGQTNVMVAPFDALHAAGIELETIEPISIDGDTHTRRTQAITLPRNPANMLHSSHRRVHFQGREFNVEYDSFRGRYNWQVQFQPPNGTTGWYRVESGTIQYNEHRLGASVFWGTADNGRHRYISAFDMQENPPMYFLAQLPDGPEITNYDQAIDSLAPPIVHQARKDGKRVYRHGDIFFIQTGLSDTDVNARGTVNERKLGRRVLQRGGASGGSRWVNPTSPRTIKSNRNVCLFGTGHTADRVTRTDGGVVLVSGTVRHEPYLVPEEADRLPEHADIVLEGERTWYLCVRNTVPAA